MLWRVWAATADILRCMPGWQGGAETILILEVELSLDEVCERLIRGYKLSKAYSIVLVAEGVGRGF